MSDFPLKKVLVANRGEIARRVMHTCRLLDVRTVAVHSEVDHNAPFVRDADEVVPLSGTSAAETYLSIEAIIQAAERAGADAIHPGYGFLSENVRFARAVRNAGITWIGPSPETMEQMGSKARARELAQRAGVPVVPGGSEGDKGDETLLAQAQTLGFPVLIKASAGGGGKGMRVVARVADFADGLEAARREARSAFGDDHLIVEKYLENPRHVEVQVFGDACGNVVHLFERECSIQRRHQKVLEESPSPALSPEQRREMGEAAVRLAREAGYANAGTVEFILDQAGAFYFLEMNTRLQVEHPVTECVTNLDLVAWQLRVAAGEPLPLAQDRITQRGHAIEVRLYAEDPAQGFVPQTGTVQTLSLPQGLGVRWDSGLETGLAVTAHYDPLLAKLIVSAPDRTGAIRRLQDALDRTVVLGVNTNLSFLQAVAKHPAFARGETTTGFIPAHFEGWLPPEPAERAWAALAAFEVLGRGEEEAIANGGAVPDPWQRVRGWRNL